MTRSIETLAQRRATTVRFGERYVQNVRDNAGRRSMQLHVMCPINLAAWLPVRCLCREACSATASSRDTGLVIHLKTCENLIGCVSLNLRDLQVSGVQCRLCNDLELQHAWQNEKNSDIPFGTKMWYPHRSAPCGMPSRTGAAAQPRTQATHSAMAVESVGSHTSIKNQPLFPKLLRDHKNSDNGLKDRPAGVGLPGSPSVLYFSHVTSNQRSTKSAQTITSGEKIRI